MGKLLEKLITNGISKVAESHHLLPDEQMGVASLLSLSISSALDNASHIRLIHNMKAKKVPRWITQFVESFLEDKTTAMNLSSFQGDQFATCNRIPQVFSRLPIMFLFFIGTLLLELQSTNSTAVGFVDDTNILTWSNSTEENVRKLEELHGL